MLCLTLPGVPTGIPWSRQRAHWVHPTNTVTSDTLSPQPKEDLKRVGQLVGMLGILCQDPDEATRACSLQGLGHLYQLLMRHKSEPVPDLHLA